MNKVILFSFFVLLFASFNMDKQEAAVWPSDKQFTHFSFLKKDNPSLDKDIQLEIKGHTISGRVPHHAKIDSLVPAFTFRGKEVSIVQTEKENGPSSLIQKSGGRANDFSSAIKYQVTAKDGTTSLYEVDVTLFTGLPILNISTEGEKEIDSKEEYMRGHADFNGGRHFDSFSADIKIRGRGNTTWHFPKNHIKSNSGIKPK